MGCFISPQDIYKRLEGGSLLVADCRGDLFDPGLGLRRYMAGHIPGAVFIDGESGLSGPVGRHGGRHPLPELADFVALMGINGLRPDMTVVAYGMYAARLVLLLELIGHRDALVLDGHHEAWEDAGYPLVLDLPSCTPQRFPMRPDLTIISKREEILRRLDDPRLLLVDVRAPERYRGEVEPIDKVAGHIPGAVNVPWERHFDDAGRILPLAAIRELYAPHRPEGRDIVIYCGSGVTSCNALLALRAAGIESRLYAGSWSDWISYPGHPLATGEG